MVLWVLGKDRMLGNIEIRVVVKPEYALVLYSMLIDQVPDSVLVGEPEVIEAEEKGGPKATIQLTDSREMRLDLELDPYANDPVSPIFRKSDSYSSGGEHCPVCGYRHDGPCAPTPPKSITPDTIWKGA